MAEPNSKLLTVSTFSILSALAFSDVLRQKAPVFHLRGGFRQTGWTTWVDPKKPEMVLYSWRFAAHS
jgi:hypothetical protein